MKKPKAIILDIEGTITDVDYVTNNLLVFFEKNLKIFLNKQYDRFEMRDWINRLKESNIIKKNSIPDFQEGKERVIEKLIENVGNILENSACTKLIKELEVMMWIWGYERQAVQGHVYEDVPNRLHTWKFVDEITIGLFSSAIITAQKLMLVRTTSGNCLPLIDHHLTPKFGSKSDFQTYLNIAHGLAIDPQELLYITDSPVEANAAVDALWNVALIFRPNNPLPLSMPLNRKCFQITSLNEVQFE